MPFVAMFAGPNGSGKSTLFNWLRDQNIDFGTYINPDEIAKGLEGSLAERSRQAQALADQARARCLDRRQDFSFETVMSHPSKVDFLELAGSLGYETVLYFVSTSDPELNVVRVSERVQRGGHDVPRDLIINRYHRSLSLLPRAIHHSRQAYIFDNSLGADIGLTLGLSKVTEPSGEVSYAFFPGAPPWIEEIYRKLLQ